MGTCNYLAVRSSVNCSATVARYIADSFRDEDVKAEFPNVDGVVSLTHSTGCGQSIKGEGLTLLRSVMAGYVTRPNVSGAVPHKLPFTIKLFAFHRSRHLTEAIYIPFNDTIF